MRRLPALAPAAMLAACGSTATTAPPAAPRTIEPDWRESTAESGDRFLFRVERLVLQPHR